MTNKTILEAVETLESAYIRILSVTICALKSVSVTESDGMALEIVQGDSRVKGAKLEFSKAAAEQPDERGCECKAIGETLAPSTYWVIERGSPAEYWISGTGNGDGTMLREEWTSDITKSPRWTDGGAKAHAKELESWGVKGPLRACEHMDCTGPEPAEQPEKEGENNIMDMALCEQDSVVLREGYFYRFTPIAGCEKCATLSAESKRDFRDPPSAHLPDSGEWQWVPKEPTEKMLEAGSQCPQMLKITNLIVLHYMRNPATNPGLGTTPQTSALAEAFRAMLLVSPKE